MPKSDKIMGGIDPRDQHGFAEYHEVLGRMFVPLEDSPPATTDLISYKDADVQARGEAEVKAALTTLAEHSGLTPSDVMTAIVAWRAMNLLMEADDAVQSEDGGHEAGSDGDSSERDVPPAVGEEQDADDADSGTGDVGTEAAEGEGGAVAATEPRRRRRSRKDSAAHAGEKGA